jgi:hypothetical protein
VEGWRLLAQTGSACQMIDSVQQKLLQKLASHKAKRIKQVQRVTEKIKPRISFVDSLVKYTEELRDRGSTSDEAKQERTLQS